VIFQESAVEGKPLIVGAIYEGSSSYGSDPISKLLKVKNQGGVRVGLGPSGSSAFIALHSTGNEADWPDHIERSTGVCTYYGDNREVGRDLLEPAGNRVLLEAFSNSFVTEEDRLSSPPFFIFTKPEGVKGKPVRFEGLAVPGSDGPRAEWCVAKLFPKEGGWYQNLVVNLTLLAVPEVSQHWLEDLRNGYTLSSNCPWWYRLWVESGQSIRLGVSS